MADKEVDIETPEEYKSLAKLGKRMAQIGWWTATIMVVVCFFAIVVLSNHGWIVASPFLIGGFGFLAFGCLAGVLGETISCFVAVARNTENTNNILREQTDILAALTEEIKSGLEKSTVDKIVDR